jgi:type II secretory pathway pseudopilin PulG
MTLQRLSAHRGYTLLPLLAFLAVAGASLMYVWAAPRDDAAVRDQRTAAALALARDTLIGRAAADDTRPGSLPCPDVDNDGVADGAFGNCTRYLGRLPWRTLGLPDVRDGWGERLWYALTMAYRDNLGGGPLNSDTPGTYSVRDASNAMLATDAPALVIAPGPALGSQSRETGNESLAAMYLDGENANADASYLSAPASDSFNDRVLIISREDLFRPVVARVAREAQAALERYRATHQYYPAANPYSAGAPAYYCEPATLRGRVPLTISGGIPVTGCTSQAAWNHEFPDWFFDNNWHLVTHYAVASVCTDTTPAGQATCTASAGPDALSIAGVSSTVRVLVIVSGPARSDQTHPCNSVGQCADDAANADGDTHYVRPSPWPASNDRMAATCAVASACAVMP